MKKKNNKAYALITGASSGIGLEFARQLGREGYGLILVARRRERLEKLEVEFRQKKVECLCLVLDLSKEEACCQLADTIKDKRIDIFINNAGYGDCGYFVDTDLEKELGMIDLNVRTMHLLMKVVLRQMQRQKGGYLLNVASSAGLMPGGPYMAAYYATKAYVASLTQAVATELKQHNSPVYVGCLCPGPVATEFNQVANVKFSLKEITAKRCVSYAISQMKKKKIVIVPTVTLKLAIFGGRFISRSFHLRLVGYQQKKKFENK